MTFKSIIKILLGLALIVISGRLTIDLGLDVPISAQTFVVLTSAYFLKSKESIILYLLYWTLGALGLPFFADGASGLEILTGTSGGYLFGFGLAAWYISSSYKLPQPALSIAFSMIIGTAIILLGGFIRLTMLKDASIAWNYGVYPFLLGAGIKGVVGALIIYIYQYFKYNKESLI